jgi:hypothetical protein
VRQIVGTKYNTTLATLKDKEVIYQKVLAEKTSISKKYNNLVSDLTSWQNKWKREKDFREHLQRKISIFKSRKLNLELEIAEIEKSKRQTEASKMEKSGNILKGSRED